MAAAEPTLRAGVDRRLRGDRRFRLCQRPDHAYHRTTTLAAFSVLGGLGASVGRAGIVKVASRHLLGAIAMAATAAVGIIFTASAGWRMNVRGKKTAPLGVS